MNYIWFLVVGIVGGVLGGMGMGGGTLLIPLLTFFLDVSQKNAQAFNLISFIPMAVIALILHYKNKLIELKGMLALIISALITSVGGSLLVSLIEGDLQTKLFGGFLILLAVIKFILTLKNNSTAK